MFGELKLACVDGAPLELKNLDAADLVAYLAFRRAQPVGAAQVAWELWSLKGEAGLARIKGAVAAVREAFAPVFRAGAVACDPLCAPGGGLQLHPYLIHVDLDEVRTAVVSIHEARERRDRAQASFLARSVSAFSRTPVLAGHQPVAWLNQGRDSVAAELASVA